MTNEEKNILYLHIKMEMQSLKALETAIKALSECIKMLERDEE